MRRDLCRVQLGANDRTAELLAHLLALFVLGVDQFHEARREVFAHGPSLGSSTRPYDRGMLERHALPSRRGYED